MISLLIFLNSTFSVVLSAIEFYDKFGFRTVEIGYKTTNRFLSIKLQAFKFLFLS